jgi:AcrR family transcriptional regulator
VTTQDKIQETSRQLFNTIGIDNVSARTICKELNISPGNFTYYYSNKNQIIADLFQEMTKENQSVLGAMAEREVNILTYLEAHKQLFLIQDKYKFFYLNQFEILTNNPRVKELYLSQAKVELKMAKDLLLLYVSKDVLIKGIREEQFERMINEGRILNNSWLVDAEILYRGNEKKKMKYYMSICCGLLEPYLTKMAKKQYDGFFMSI